MAKSKSKAPGKRGKGKGKGSAGKGASAAPAVRPDGGSGGGGGGKDSSKIWSVFSLVSALGAAALAKRTLNTTWKAATGKNPPENPADPDVALREAVMWAAASGTFVALARMLAQRKAANYYHRSTGHLPPGLEKD